MALSAGSVYAVLGGRFERAAFDQYGSAMYRARDETEAAEKRMSAAHNRVAQSSAQMGRALKTAATGGAVALVAAVAGSVKVAADFDKSMRNVNSIAKLNDAQFKSLSKSVLALAGPTAQSPKTLAEGMYQLVSSGFKAQDALKILRSSAIAATAGLTDTGTATTAVAAVLNAYQLKAKDAGRVSDQLFQTVNRGVITFDVLAHNIGQVLPFASSLGVGLNQVGASISTLTKEGLSGELAITDLKNVMSSFLKPSKGLAEAIKQTGASSGEALVKSRGFQGALEAVAKTTDGTKSAMTKLFPNIRALTAALDLTGKSASTAEGDVSAFKNTTGATSQVFGEQAKSAAFQWQKFKAELSATGVVIGQAVLPVLSKGVDAVAKWVTGLQHSGQAAAFGHQVAAGFKEAGQVFSDFIGVGRQVAGVFVDIGRALQLGNTTNLEALLAAIAGFKIAGVVAPLVANLASGLSSLVLNARTAPTLAAFFSDLPIGPVGLLASGVAILAGALVLLGGNEKSEAQAARDVAQAKQAEAQAISQAQDAALAAADATFGARIADQELAKAKDHLAQVADKYGKGSKQYRAALQDEHIASLRSVEDHKHLADAKAHDNTQTQQAIEGAKKQQQVAKEQIGTIARQIAEGHGSAEQTAKLNAAVRDYTDAQGKATLATNLRQLRELQLQRLLHDGDLITNKNAAAVAHLAGVYGQLPKAVQTKIDALPQSALAKIGNVLGQLHGVDKAKATATILARANSATAVVQAFKALLAGVPLQKVAHILATTSGTAEVQALNAQINAVHSTSATVTTYVKTIRSVQQGAASSPGAGFGPQPGKPAGVHGRAAGGRTNGPQMYLVGEGDDPVEWIIPRDRKYRGRALGLLMDAAASLLPAAKTGAKHDTKHHAHRFVPKPTQYLRLSPDQYQTADQNAQQHLDNLRQDAKAKDAKGHHTKAALKAEGEIPAAQRARDKAHAEYEAARAFANRIAAHEQEADIARTQMGTADSRDDQKAYDTARAKRVRELQAALGELNREHGFAKAGSQWERDIRQALAQVTSDIRDTNTSVSQATQDQASAAVQATQDAASAEAQTGMTAAETTRLSAINEAIALAALTPGLDDDQAAAGDLVSFLTGVLGEAQSDPARGGADTITAIAGQLKTAQDNAASLVPGGSSSSAPNDNPDLQAQITQLQTNLASAQTAAAINAQTLAVFAGTGDIGTGGANARQAVININTLHPADPATLRAIGDAATAGMALQPSISSSREKVGV